MNTVVSLEQYAVLAETCAALYAIDPLQRKAVQQHLQALDGEALQQIESLLGLLQGFLRNAYGVTLADCTRAYSAMCREMLVEQIKFSRTGRYSASCPEEVRAHVYAAEETMTHYIYGLALSILLWPNHFAMYQFYIEQLNAIDAVDAYLEVGPGHGLFTLQAMRCWSEAQFTAVDISPASAEITSAFMRHCFSQRSLHLQIQDFNEFEHGQYDFITMGEVLEHLADPMRALNNIRALLKPNGYSFISTCANCPAVDHIYLFHDADDIREHLIKAGFAIVRDIALPVQNLATSAKTKPGINYAALVR